METPSIEIVEEYLGNYSLVSKEYRTQGGKDQLFREIARVLLEYGFVYPRPPSIPKNRIGFIIATYKGLWVDWAAKIVDSLREAVAGVVDDKKAWSGIAQWLTILAPPQLAIQPKRKRRPETTPRSTRRQQLLNQEVTGWIEGFPQRVESPPTMWGAKYTEKDSEQKLDGLGHKATQRVMGVPDDI